MTEQNYDDPVVEEQWCTERRAQVAAYLKSEGIEHGQISDWPAWHVVPYISIWAIESAQHHNWVGWWVVCGDFPTDYISAAKIKHPRDAMKAISERWGEVAGCMLRGEAHPTIQIGSGEND